MTARLLLALTVLLSLDLAATSAAEPKRLLLVGQGPDGHPPASHEFMAGLRVIEKSLRGVEGLQVTTVKADEPWKDGVQMLKQADGVVLYVSQGAKWMQADAGLYDAFTAFAARGGGIVALHWAVGAKDAKYIDGQLKLLGGTRGGPQRKYTVADFDLRLPTPDHPIVRGIKPFAIRDELYYRLDFLPGAFGTAAATAAAAASAETANADEAKKLKFDRIFAATIDGNDETVAWAWQRPDGGRSFGYVGMHFHDNWKLVEYRRLAAQAALWTLKMDVPEEGLKVAIDEEDLRLPKPVKK
ncbi:MAG: ThuA domain-containing protein [Pirellulales bacterium]